MGKRREDPSAVVSAGRERAFKVKANADSRDGSIDRMTDRIQPMEYPGFNGAGNLFAQEGR